MPQAFSDSPRPEFIPFTIPYLCKSAPYDGKDFWTYPERRGWRLNVKDEQCHVFCPPGHCEYGMGFAEIQAEDDRIQPPMLSRLDGRPVRASDKVAFLQAWLFFGVLEEVSSLCRLEIDVAADFIFNDELISTKKLNGLSERWFQAAMEMRRAGEKEVVRRILTVARHSSLMLRSEITDIRNVASESAEVFRDVSDSTYTYRYNYAYAECRVLLSLDILRRAGIREESVKVSSGLAPALLKEWHNFLTSQFVDLEEKGWCKSELAILEDGDLIFASLLPRPRIMDHSHCGNVICGAYQTDEVTYKSRHVKDWCCCDFIEVKSDALTSVLSKDEVPKLVITEELELQMVSEQDYPYVAISHGPTDSETQCQTRFPDVNFNVYGIIASPLALWMDTLCIPVHADAKIHRRKAITLLGKTFSRATAVLVLDRELEMVESATATFLELALRIICSGWAKRLWTLQEATLASEVQGSDKLYFQMRDGPFLYQKNERNREQKSQKGTESRSMVGFEEVDFEERSLLRDEAVTELLRKIIPGVQAIRNSNPPSSNLFLNVYDAIEHRSTSKFEDIPVCIASLLGHDPSPIVSVSDAEHRMARLYMLLHEVPCGVAWVPTTERLSISPFRWAPRSIAACQGNDWFSAWEDGICDISGLHFKATGFVFTESEVERHGIGSALPNVFNLVSEVSGVRVNQLLWPQLRQRPITASKILIQPGLAFIFRPLLSSDDVLAQSGKIPQGNDVIAVLIENNAESVGGTQSSELVCRVIGFLTGEQPIDNLEPELRRGYVTRHDQRWCLT
ncbi:hypothetical protein VKT23_004897 [Stygiomarasmius scandens]|uniref:Heterokaryon incompatibility domain-containing protein n=1 Tax=Marasmiellus scandens TaxID=2682957 RepID=A0ABR1JS49_9AGAR